MIGCMRVAAEGAADAATLELSKLAHTSMTALAKRATHRVQAGGPLS